MERPRTPEQEALSEMTTAIEIIRYTIRSTYGLDNNAAQRVRRISEELKESLDALKMDYCNRNTPAA